MLSLSPSPFLTLSPISFSVSLSFLFLRRPLEGHPPTHRGRPFLRLHQRQLHRCKWKRIECYYWLPTKPTKPHPLARMSGLYTFIASPIRVIHHAMSSKTLQCVFLWCLALIASFLRVSVNSRVNQSPHARVFMCN